MNRIARRLQRADLDKGLAKRLALELSSGCIVALCAVACQLFTILFSTLGENMLTLEQIRIGLSDRVISKISAATGVHYNTIRAIKDNPDANPTYRVLVALSEYLEGRNSRQQSDPSEQG